MGKNNLKKGAYESIVIEFSESINIFHVMIYKIINFCKKQIFRVFSEKKKKDNLSPLPATLLVLTCSGIDSGGLSGARAGLGSFNTNNILYIHQA